MRASRTITAFIDPDAARAALERQIRWLAAFGLALAAALIAAALATWTVEDPSLSNATGGEASNLLGRPGAVVADLAMQLFGLGSLLFVVLAGGWAMRLATGRAIGRRRWRLAAVLPAALLAATALATLSVPERWPLPTGLGGVCGDLLFQLFGQPSLLLRLAVGVVAGVGALGFTGFAAAFIGSPPTHARGEVHRTAYRGEPVAAPVSRRRVTASALEPDEEEGDEEESDEPGRFAALIGYLQHMALLAAALLRRLIGLRRPPPMRQTTLIERLFGHDADAEDEEEIDFAPAWRSERLAPAARAEEDEEAPLEPARPRKVPQASPSARVTMPAAKPRPGRRIAREQQPSFLDAGGFVLPPLTLLAEPRSLGPGHGISKEALEQNARLLEGVLEDFGVRGEIVHVRPGPVVTLYELEPAPGIKSSRVISLADDIARSMSAIATRVAVIPGKNAIGIELPNHRRETVYLRELLASADFENTKARLPLCLGKTIGGESVIADLARMPHLLIAGTTGSGKSVAINTMILSLVYRLEPAQCRLIMIDPKMLELSVYDGIPHLLTPVVTDPKKAVVALKWTVREMEDRYRKMSKLGVRNIDGYNTRLAQAAARGERLTRTVQTGFDRETGEAIFEHEELDLEPMPFIVVIVDEMADLMMVAGKEIEGAIQRLAQMARAAGIHLIMATQRPSVDVITGTIKANFPTRISFQVTSKIDSRTILGEQGAEQLLGQGDMLYMAGGGRISRVHGPFVSDEEVERVVAHLKAQGVPDYLDTIVEDDGSEEGDGGGALFGGEDGGGDLYDQAVAIVLRDRKASTSYIQRRLQIGYNRAASLIERMEKEGVVGPANHAGKREILIGRDGDE